MKKKKMTVLAILILFGLFLLFAGCNGSGGGGGDGGGGGAGDDDSDVGTTSTTPVVAFDQDASWGEESVGQANLAVSLIANSGQRVTVDYEVTGGSAEGGGVDYTLAPGTLIFNPNEDSKFITIDIVDDAQPEDNETIVVSLSAPVNATLGTSNSHIYTIIDDEPQIVVAINQIDTECKFFGFGPTEVTVFVSVVDRDGEPITDLEDCDFRLFEDSEEVPCGSFTVKYIDTLALPVSVALTMDYSGSMFATQAIDPMEDAAVAFVKLLRPDDKAEIIKFAKDIVVVQEFTDNLRDLIDGIESGTNLKRNRTSLYDALNEAIDDTAQEPDRKAVVGITDGQDNSSLSTADDVIANALLNDIPIFIIGLGDDIDVSSLDRIAKETGGIFYLAATTDDLQNIYELIAEILAYNQYVIQYDSILKGAVKLKVEVDYNGQRDSDSKPFTTCD